MRNLPMLLLVPAALALALSACQGAGSLEPTSNATATSSSQGSKHASPAHEVCGETQTRVDTSGGSQRVPAIAEVRTLDGQFAYASFVENGKVQAITFSCPTSDPIAPIPTGYTPDWFGEWDLVCSGGCPNLTFANANLTGHIISKTWMQNTNYYLYVYDLYSRQFIESYPIGPVTKEKNGRSSLGFTSPFENGFVSPADEGIALEIVHS